MTKTSTPGDGGSTNDDPHDDRRPLHATSQAGGSQNDEDGSSQTDRDMDSQVDADQPHETEKPAKADRDSDAAERAG